MKLGMPLNEVRTLWAKVLSDKPNASVRTIDLNLKVVAWLHTPNQPTIFFRQSSCFSFTSPFMRYKMPYKCESFEIKVKNLKRKESIT